MNNEVDAAFNHTNGQAKMPTYSQIYELVSYTNILWTNDYKESGVPGIIFTNKKKSSKFIFIPAYGYAHHNDFYDVGYYSSCSSCQASDELKYDIYIGDDICKLQPFFGDFTMAFPTRGVKIKV